MKQQQPSFPQPKEAATTKLIPPIAQEAIKDKGTTNTHNCKLSKSNHKLSLYFRLRCNIALNKEGYINKSVCRPNKRVQREPGPVNTTFMGTSNTARVSAATDDSASSGDSSTTDAISTRSISVEVKQC